MREREVASLNLTIYKTYKFKHISLSKVIDRVGELFLEFKKMFCCFFYFFDS
jgi:hypothetical protein